MSMLIVLPVLGLRIPRPSDGLMIEADDFRGIHAVRRET